MPIVRTTVESSIYSEPEVAASFWDRTERLRKRGWSTQRIAALFPYPSGLARLTMIFRSRDVWKLSEGVAAVDVYNRLAQLLYTKYASDPFALDGSNRLWSSTQCRAALRKHRTPLSGDVLAALDGRLWLFTESQFARWHNLGHEYHGPYTVNGQRTLVKEWHDLQGLKQGALARFPHRHIRTIERIGRARVHIDLHNRFESQRSSAEIIRGGFLEIDGRPASATDAQLLKDTLDASLKRSAAFLATLTPKRVKTINAFMEFYAIRPLADALHEDWQPPQALLRRIQQGKLERRQRTLLTILSGSYAQMNRAMIRRVYRPTGTLIGF